MDRIIVEGGKRLIGEIDISGAKNAALPIMAATLLIEDTNTLTNLPDLRDIATFKTLLSHLGCVIKDQDDSTTIDASRITTPEAPYELVKTMRASVLVLGPLVARCKRARISLPGGCAIGARPINLHLMGLEKMGATIKIEHGYVEATAERLRGSVIYLDIPTVTGTANLMMAACLADGTTVLENTAKEPEVVELANLLNNMGGSVAGAGTEKVVIEGVDRLHPVSHSVMADRIEAGTYMIAAAATRGNLLLKNCPIDLLEALTLKLKETGTEITVEEGGVRVIGNTPIRSVDIQTSPYPGFPTDLQAQMMALMTVASGLSVITETIFENRFMHVSELKRMGAKIKIDGRTAIVEGRPYLSSAPVMATDLRASASLVIAALIVDGITDISRIYHLDRGYERLEKKLAGVGAKIKRIKG
ncbi:MAG: UDP-N-acetylglucosamine 1-carboxyvinyltransferase [Deltaproteobacteria bacterium]|nr:UDP-N-acetylglucosamine 1-carboxyvinyltransferase [Deltaproteobacteria bacterium]